MTGICTMGLDAKNRLRHLRTSRADQTRKTQDLAFRHVKADAVMRPIRRAQALDLKIRALLRALALYKEILEFAAPPSALPSFTCHAAS
jgi:hypothetical protein